MLESVSRYIEKELKLVVNRTKSKATRPWKSQLLGYSFYRWKGEKRLNIAGKSIEKYKTQVREITSRSRLGTPEVKAYQWGNTRRGYWRACHSPILTRALNSAFLKREGYLTLKELGTLPTVLF